MCECVWSVRRTEKSTRSLQWLVQREAHRRHHKSNWSSARRGDGNEMRRLSRGRLHRSSPSKSVYLYMPYIVLEINMFCCLYITTFVFTLGSCCPRSPPVCRSCVGLLHTVRSRTKSWHSLSGAVQSQYMHRVASMANGTWQVCCTKADGKEQQRRRYHALFCNWRQLCASPVCTRCVRLP